MCINHSNVITNSCKPKFAQITRLLMHSYVEKNSVFAKVIFLGESSFDTELDMWYAKSLEDENVKALYVLQDLSQPLVVACENEDVTTTCTCVWFLNYHRLLKIILHSYICMYVNTIATVAVCIYNVRTSMAISYSINCSYK